MDPNEVYAQLAELAAKPVPVRDDPAETKALAMQMQAAFVALDEWIKRGGFLPKAWTTDWPAFAREQLKRAEARRVAAGNPAMAAVELCSQECGRESCLTYGPMRVCTYTTRELKELADDGS